MSTKKAILAIPMAELPAPWRPLLVPSTTSSPRPQHQQHSAAAPPPRGIQGPQISRPCVAAGTGREYSNNVRSRPAASTRTQQMTAAKDVAGIYTAGRCPLSLFLRSSIKRIVTERSPAPGSAAGEAKKLQRRTVTRKNILVIFSTY